MKVEREWEREGGRVKECSEAILRKETWRIGEQIQPLYLIYNNDLFAIDRHIANATFKSAIPNIVPKRFLFHFGVVKLSNERNICNKQTWHVGNT